VAKGPDLRKGIAFSSSEAKLIKDALSALSDSPLRNSIFLKTSALIDDTITLGTRMKPIHAENMQILTEAIAEKRQVVLRNYRSSNSRTTADRVIEPYAVIDNGRQVLGFELSTRLNKAWRVERADDVKKLDSPAENDIYYKTVKEDVFGIQMSGKAKPVSFSMTMVAYNVLLEEHPAALFLTKPLPNTDRWLFEGEVSDYRRAGRFVLGLPDQVTVVGSVEFKAYVQEALGKQTLLKQ
jgi:predicted DNA-binding transcriptional regulator YafY